MNLLEFEGKQLFAKYGISTPIGELYDGSSPLEGASFPLVVKAQVPIGGRGKAGGIRVVRDRKELDQALKEQLGMTIKGYRVQNVLVEENIESEMELYLSITVDRSMRKPVIMASAMGGMDIESVPDGEILREWIDPSVGLQPFVSDNLIRALELKGKLADQFRFVLESLWRLFQEIDAELVEINPLAVTVDKSLVAVDSKVVVDDDSLFRHERLRKHARAITPLERKAGEKGIAFVQLEGDIGVIANGAGLTMATLDFLMLHGGKGGFFLDLGGTDDPEKVKEALLLAVEARPKVVLINIFGGITKCDTVASGLLQAFNEGCIDLPIVARIKGVNEKEAIELLKDSKILPALSLDEAAKAAVDISSGA